MSFVLSSLVITLAFGALIVVIRKNLQRRELARKLRTIFIAQAEDLVSKPEFPVEHARLLVNMAAVPEGWATRYFVMRLFAELVGLPKLTKKPKTPTIEQVPVALRRKYVLAMLAFTLSDSYRSTVLGHIFRATNSWLLDAVKEPKTDVNAHATRNVVDQVAQVPARKLHRHGEFAAV